MQDEVWAIGTLRNNLHSALQQIRLFSLQNGVSHYPYGGGYSSHISANTK